ncbi:MAG: Ser/Thr protein kinase RdoA (MazF antagonist) [Rhodothermales bacterium]|jgi:Ser/Thr protein kinase RdoA (MazF antagonist)
MSAALIAATEAALHAWDIAPQRISLASKSENIVFRVDATCGSYVLRFHRPGYHSADSLVSEQVWTQALNAAGIDAPTPVPTRDGSPLAQTNLDGQAHHVGLLKWVDGEIMRSAMTAKNQLEAFHRLGSLLATMHNQATSWELPAGFDRPQIGADGLMGEQPVWGRFWEAPMLSAAQATLLCELRKRIYSILLEYVEEPQSFSLIHSDLHAGNVVLAGDSLHVIDFDDAAFGWHIYDIAIALKEYEDHAEYSGFLEALMRGYRSQRPFAESHLSYLPLFLLIRRLNAIGWVADRPDLELAGYHGELMAYIQSHAALVR